MLINKKDVVKEKHFATLLSSDDAMMPCIFFR